MEATLSKQVPLYDAIIECARKLAEHNDDKWRGPLTPHQRRLIALYVDGTSKLDPASIMPANITYVSVGGRKMWARHPLDPALAIETEQAFYQREAFGEQYAEACDLLAEEGFDLGAESLDGKEFESFLAKCFSTNSPRRGRPEEYAWRKVEEDLQKWYDKDGGMSDEELMAKCIDFAQTHHPKNKEPDRHTVKRKIIKFNFDRFLKARRK